MKVIEAISAGKTVTNPGVDRDRLAVSDHRPAMEPASLRSGKPMAATFIGGTRWHGGDRPPGVRCPAFIRQRRRDARKRRPQD